MRKKVMELLRRKKKRKLHRDKDVKREKMTLLHIFFKIEIIILQKFILHGKILFPLSICEMQEKPKKIVIMVRINIIR